MMYAKGGLRLHKFISNSREVLESIPSSELAGNVRDLDLSFEDLPLESVMGFTNRSLVLELRTDPEGHAQEAEQHVTKE